MHKGSNFIIEIKDDGRGIDTQKILEKAIERGIASSDENYTKEEILNFLLIAGFQQHLLLQILVVEVWGLGCC